MTNALLITTRTDAGPTGQWEDLMIVSLDAPDKLSLVTSATAKSMEPLMITKMFKYHRK